MFPFVGLIRSDLVQSNPNLASHLQAATWKKCDPTFGVLLCRTTGINTVLFTMTLLISRLLAGSPALRRS